MGFSHSKANISLFILQIAHYVIFTLVFVDDIIIIGSSSTVVAFVIHKLGLEFAIKDLGHLNLFLLRSGSSFSQ